MSMHRINPSGEGRDHRRRGVAMMLVLIAIVIATVMAMGFMHAQSTSTLIARNVQGTTSARVIAESGLAMALRQVRTDSSWRTSHPNGTWVSNASYGGGTLTVTGKLDTDGDGTVEQGESLNDTSSQPIVITATGTSGGVTHSVSAKVSVQSGVAFSPGIAVSNAAELDSYGLIDSYDSSMGAYSSTNKGTAAVVSTNSTAAGKIDVKGGAILKGNAFAGKGGSTATVITVDSSSHITGAKSVLGDPVTMPTVTVPTIAGGLLGDLLALLGLVDLTTDRHYTNLTVILGTVRVTGNVRVVVENNLTMLLGGKITVTPGSRLELYVKRATSISSSAELNDDSGSPGQLIFYNAGTDDITVNNASMSAYVVSPSGRLLLDSGATFYGSFTGAGVRVRGSGSAIHNDTSHQKGSKQHINFDSYSTGNVAGQDSWVKPAAYVTSSNAQIVSTSGGSGRHLRVSSTSEATAVYRSFTTYTGQTAVRVRWFWKPTSSSVRQAVGLMASDRTGATFSDLSVRAQMETSGKFSLNGTTGTVSYSTAGHWCDLYVTGLNTPATAKASFFVDGVAVAQNVALLRNPGAFALNRLVVKADTTGGAAGGQELDYVNFGDTAGTVSSSTAAPTYTPMWSEQP